MSDINIALIEPEIPQNTGNIARTCAVTGAALHLVKPLGFEIDDKKLKHAGLDYWHSLDITYYESLDDFLQKTAGEEMYFFSTKALHKHTDVVYPKRVFLVFGKESKGLPEQLLKEHEKQCVRIPMRDDMRSLNLSNSVAVGVYEALRQRDFSGMQTVGKLHRLEW